jgi:Uncharacterized conserved protein, contains double-stranded beta-helix domain
MRVKAFAKRETNPIGIRAHRSMLLPATLGVIIALSACEQPSQPAISQTAESDARPLYTASVGSTSTLLGRASFADAFNLKRKTGDWKVRVDSDPLDVAVQTIVFPAGSSSGWHMHPGPVFIMVTQGQMTFYEADDPTCTPVVRSAGQGYLDSGDHGHIARNETQLESRNVVTYLAPPGAALRIDMPAPGNCAF